MERNAVLAIAISLLILVLWNEFVIKQYAPPIEPDREIAAPTADRADPARPAPRAPAAAPAAAAPAAARPTNPSVDRDRLAGRDVTVETDLFRAVFTTAGARLKSLQLLNYDETPDPDSPAQELVHVLPHSDLPLGVSLRGGADSLDDSSIEYTVDRDSLRLSGEETASLTFVGRSGGTTITKRFDLSGHRYLWSAQVDVDNPPAFATEIAVTWNGVLEEEAGGYSAATASRNPYSYVLALNADQLEHLSRDDIVVDIDSRVPAQERRTGTSFAGPIEWIGLSGQYFFAGLVVSEGEKTEDAVAWAGNTDGWVQAMLRFEKEVSSANLTIFTGPKDIDLLDMAGHQLRRALDLGWFTIVALPMLQLIRFLHRFTSNYGIDIILLTVLIKLLFYPLTKKSFQSMKGMQKLQPKMEKLKELYKDKPDEMNKAVMEMYRKEGVNPLGGCLPMFLQLPVFIGLYNALLNAVELRHAPFAFWIQDLSAPDRLGDIQLPFVTGAGFPILTLIMGASMLLQQKMTPTTTADPMQQRMMMLMPVVFTFMFINFPSGLVLYWLVNNILTIGQQYLINRQED